MPIENLLEKPICLIETCTLRCQCFPENDKPVRLTKTFTNISFLTIFLCINILQYQRFTLQSIVSKDPERKGSGSLIVSIG